MSVITSVQPDWDVIDPSALLELVGFRKTTTEFGYLLRHYWMPDTEIQFRVVTEQHAPNGDMQTAEQIIRQTPAKCDADRFFWREHVLKRHGEENLIHCSPFRPDETLCVYDRSAQTFRWGRPLDFERQPVTDVEAMSQAFLSQPVLTPLMPILVDFAWHVRHDEGYLDFTLESATWQGEMTVLFIRRKGKFRLNAFYRDGQRYEQDYLVEREGVTAYALERSMILEDRTRDVLRSAKPMLDGLVTETRRTLIRSEWNPEARCTAPLTMVLPVQNDKAYRFRYDCGTGRILRLDENTNRILDDFRLLTDDEIRQKYKELGAEQVGAALTHIHDAARDGYFAEHPPMELSPIDVTEYQGQNHDLGEFWKKTGVLLVLGLTERCNMGCRYCCYSGNFAGQRTHSGKTMRWDVAEKAISFFIENDQVDDINCPITFYGGEPLIEFDLLKRCVEYAETKAKELGKQIRFAITTNGTLLDDEVTDYLVAHHFLIMVSIDGAAASHDRYRVFPDGSGSFDLIDRNVRRFAARYPEYIARGFNMTLAPPLDLDAASALAEELVPFYPLSRVALVNTGTELRFRDGQTTGTTRYGCHDTCKQMNASPLSVEMFRQFGDDDFRQMNDRWLAYKAAVTQHGAAQTREIMPFNAFLFERQMDFYHRRKVTKYARSWQFFIPCVPGFTRRFCDADGNYLVCERVDNSRAYRLGNVWDGLDPEMLVRTMEMRRHFGDCANCSAMKTCDLCYARIPETDAIDAGFDPLFDVVCQRTRKATQNLLQAYTEIMEENPTAFEKPQKNSEARRKDLKYGSTSREMNELTRSRLQLETF